MFSIYRKIKDEIVIDDVVYSINASFDNILRLIELSNDDLANDVQVTLAIKMLFGKETDMSKFTLAEWFNIYQSIIDEYISSKEEIEYDDLGEPMPVVRKNEKLIDIDLDAEYIYSSFIQAYGIDLVEQQGQLHWYKFRALLAGLPSNTKMREIMGYRAYKKPNKSDTHHSQMMELKQHYALPDSEFEGEEADEWQMEE